MWQVCCWLDVEQRHTEPRYDQYFDLICSCFVVLARDVFQLCKRGVGMHRHHGNNQMAHLHHEGNGGVSWDVMGAQGISLICGGAQGIARSECEEDV